MDGGGGRLPVDGNCGRPPADGAAVRLRRTALEDGPGRRRTWDRRTRPWTSGHVTTLDVPATCLVRPHPFHRLPPPESWRFRVLQHFQPFPLAVAPSQAGSVLFRFPRGPPGLLAFTVHFNSGNGEISISFTPDLRIPQLAPKGGKCRDARSGM
jgi:hypothetical protein